MKKILALSLFCVLFSALPILADDIDGISDFSGIGDMSKSYSVMDNAYNGQKKITDEEFQKTLEAVKAKKKKKRSEKPLKGKNFNEENSGGLIDETAQNLLILGIPIELLNSDGKEIPVGHYKIVGKKIKNKAYLDFYQSYTLIASIPATETNDDFGQKEINFVKLLPVDSQTIKVIYGSIDFNAYSFIKIKTEISDRN